MLLSGNIQSEQVAVWEMFQIMFYRIINTLRLSGPVLILGNVQSEIVVAGESFQTMILTEH